MPLPMTIPLRLKLSSAMAKVSKKHCLCVALVLNLVFGFQVHAVPYDHSFSNECLAKPIAPQYDGGIVLNSELNQGLNGWTTFGEAKIKHHKSEDGNNYIVAFDRKLPSHSLSQKFDLDKDKLYSFSAWLQVSHGNALIAAVFRTTTGNHTAGWVIAREGCWSMLKGGLVVNASAPAQLYFESNNTKVDIRADSISLQPFTHQEWKSHQEHNIEKVRKRRVKIQATDEWGRPISNATISIKQVRPDFPFGCAINSYITQNTAYQNWFTSRFRYTVFENEMKWYATEKAPEAEDYSVPDAMLQFAKSHGISVRGHNVFWDDPNGTPSWVRGLSANTLGAAANRRINSVVKRYQGQLIHWDVVNENLHFNFYESKLGNNASAMFYQQANTIDPRATPFLNEYNTIEEPTDGKVSPAKYLEKIREIRQQGYNGPLGIGLESHFRLPNLPYIRAALDSFKATGLPIWITELDVSSGPNQVVYLEQLLREFHAHPAIQGMLVWGAWNPEQKCYRMCLVDKNFNNLPTGDVVDKVLSEWTHSADDKLQVTTDADGFFENSLFHGEYEVKITHPTRLTSSTLQKINVLPNEEHGPLHLQIKA